MMAKRAAKAKTNGAARASEARKTAAKRTKTANAGLKAKRTAKPDVKPKSAAAKPVKLLSGGNPQIAKADGDAPVQAYIAAMPGWKREVGRRLDAIILSAVPDVRKAVRWNCPFYGTEDQGWFLAFHCYTKSSRWLSSAGPHCALSRPASPSKRKCATSTSMKTIRSMRRR
jgi:hypothetical protein